MMHFKAPHCHPLSPGLATGTLAASCQGQKWQQLCVQNMPVGGLVPPYFSVQPLAYVITISPSEALHTGFVLDALAFARPILLSVRVHGYYWNVEKEHRGASLHNHMAGRSPRHCKVQSSQCQGPGPEVMDTGTDLPKGAAESTSDQNHLEVGRWGGGVTFIVSLHRFCFHLLHCGQRGGDTRRRQLCRWRSAPAVLKISGSTVGAHVSHRAWWGRVAEHFSGAEWGMPSGSLHVRSVVFLAECVHQLSGVHLGCPLVRSWSPGSSGHMSIPQHTTRPLLGGGACQGH